MQSLNDSLQKQIDQLKNDNEILSNERNDAIQSIKALHSQQCDLYKSFKLLRGKYDDLKVETQHILWEFIPSQHNDNFNSFSELENVNLSVFETPNQISNYLIGPLLGEGQFAKVKLCINTITQNQYAMKVINKRKVSTLAGLKRVKNEVTLLKQLNHPNIITFVDFIHSPKNIYLITEIGGKDLFEFFEANPLGVTGETARQIILGIVQPLLYLHKSGICHRDLKPENILLSEKKDGLPLNESIQICDFGQSVISSSKDVKGLSGLCGSPGFFAPEMILSGDERYNGFAADVWSVGCVMLELTRGHDEFCRIWMTSYDYNILQNEQEFETSLNRAVHEVHSKQSNEFEKMEGELCDFLRKILVLNPDNRLKTAEMLQHQWLNRDRGMHSKTASRLHSAGTQDDTSSQSSGRSSESDTNETFRLRTKRNLFRNSFSSRARKHFVGANGKGIDKVILTDMSIANSDADDGVNKSHERIEIRLPPVEPETPSFKAAKRTMMEGKKIAKKATVSAFDFMK
jgi:serine/threonine protein kinase